MLEESKQYFFEEVYLGPSIRRRNQMTFIIFEFEARKRHSVKEQKFFAPLFFKKASIF